MAGEIRALMENQGMRNRLAQALRDNGIVAIADPEVDGDIHSWRCKYPEVYGPCTCFSELIDALVAAVDPERLSTVAHPIPPELCAAKGCVFLKLHEGKHSWNSQK